MEPTGDVVRDSRACTEDGVWGGDSANDSWDANSFFRGLAEESICTLKLRCTLTVELE